MSDEEEAGEKNPDGSKVIKVMRPSFRSERFNQLIDDLDDQWRNPEDNASGKVQRNNRLNRIYSEEVIPFPRHLNEADFPAWAFNS
ncbi:uncharacterized protein BX663DRAFT_511665 [Cokeromyces recurvatus]|uniref:uncharacterized protein n=1 Tax=Cokeromyces recurvatus TaxID=90255 RepID=UPI0022205EDC|nr:uncharacterized protein BX663DRAFT_511665 [Cokeromyces recurvatus]KAI7902074.1 hypothetical protein BX663DRAFT_511665 [Cokeromyces recurvatus]